jgi:signal transduction histidine kinase
MPRPNPLPAPIPLRRRSIILFLTVATYLALCSGSLATISFAGAGEAPNDAAAITVTSVNQLRLLAAQAPTISYSIHLAGDVWWASPAQGRLVLKDDSGVEEVELNMQGAPPLEAGQRISIEGNGTITPVGAAFKIGARGPVVDNDGVHGMVEKSGAIYLKAGRNPLRVEWFNGAAGYGLEVEYQGPALPRQKIPDTALSRLQVDPATGASNWVNGLDFRCAEAPAEFVPDFETTNILKSGTVTNFDLSVMPRPEHVGIRFSGYLDVARDGLYTFYTRSDDGSRLFVGNPTLQLKILGSAAFPASRSVSPGQKLAANDTSRWGEVEGKVTFLSADSEGLKLELCAGSGCVRVEVANAAGLSSAQLLNRRVRATGYCQSNRTADSREVLGVLLVPGRQQIILLDSLPASTESASTNAGGLPFLVTAAEIHGLVREEAQRGYPVRIGGVITCVLPDQQAFTLQDSTRGVYVIDFSQSRSDPPRIGEFVEVEGTTDPGKFAPEVSARRVRLLGAGDLPEPLHPTRDQLMNGSLDAQYVELKGILTSIHSNEVTLLTTDGRVKAELRVNGLKPGDLERFGDALIRVRGCLLANWDYLTHQVKVDEFRIFGADITVDQPGPKDLFSSRRKTTSELLLFDPQASVFQRVKVSGQVIHERDSEYFIMDDKGGVRFIAKHPEELQVGDFVDVVGFPELSLGSPVLREAVVRKNGHGILSKPKMLSQDDLTRTDLDSTRVAVRAMLVNLRPTPTGHALEMRMGLRSFLARLPGAADERVRAIPSGSQLELIGTYASQSVNLDVASFELLLNSAADIAVLARPQWWTLEKMLVILGVLACVLAGTVLWITQLHRTVAQRTVELEIQIHERQRVEQQHAMESERARIAQDLHDELGSGLTEISMLGARARSSSAPVETRRGYLDQMNGKARQMVSALDEIVWAMNPAHDSLASMISYFSLYAERFLGLANISWRFDGPPGEEDHVVDSRHRYQLFLAFKEALNNIVRHSGATDVRIRIAVESGSLQLTIADNGRGFAEGGRTGDMDGVANMRARLAKLGGRFEVESKAGEGATVRFHLPVH